MFVAAAARPGRGHRQRGLPCQDSHAAWRDPSGGRAVAAVADGLGSCPRSDAGSRAAAGAAVAAMAAEPVWDEAAVVRAFEAARAAVEAEAARLGAEPSDLSTTLQLAALDGPRLLAAMVGDGAVVAHLEAAASGDSASAEAAGSAGPGSESDLVVVGDSSPEVALVRIVLAPALGGYANEVVPVTAERWRESLRVASMDGVRSALLFSDGLTRLLLQRSKAGWTPFTPFFDSFLPRLEDPEAAAAAVEALVGGDEVDRAWDDDKCLAVISHG